LRFALLFNRLFLALLDSLVKRLKNSRVNSRDHVDSSIEFFFRHARFPCVRKAAFHSWIAEPHHRHREPYEHLFTLAQTRHRVGIPVESTEIGLIHLVTPVIARWAQHAAPLQVTELSSSLVSCLLVNSDLNSGAAIQKDLRGKARENSTHGGVRRRYVDARRLSATKHMSLFQSLRYGLTPHISAYENPPLTCT